MPIAFTCPHCSTDFPVAEDDVGFSVYCQSCGKECDVPETLGVKATPVVSSMTDGVAGAGAQRSPGDADRRHFEPGSVPRTTASESRPTEMKAGPVVEPKPRRASVFTAEGASRILERPAGEVECFRCNTKIPYTLEQQGTTVYCPSCGDGVPVGQQLQKIAVARAATLRTDHDPVDVAAPRPRFYWFRSRAGLATLATAFLVLAGGVFATWKNPDLLPEGIRNVLPTGEAAAPQVDRKSAGKKDDKRSDEELITLEAIRKLLDRPDTRMALIQAQYWEQDLKRLKLPAAEPRRKELTKVIAALFARLTPQPKGTPKYVLRFRKLIDDLGKTLGDGKAAEARKLYDEANAIFRKHPKELADESSWLVRYGAWLARLEWKATGVRTVETWLNRAAELARAGKPTQALEFQARAKWLTGNLKSMTDEEFARLNKLNSEIVEPLVSWARGKRAVYDAAECQKNQDKAARDQQLEIAAAKLPEIPQSLPGVPDTDAKSLNTDARKSAATSIFSPVSTTLGKELDVRFQYEQSLAHLGQGKIADFAAAAADVKKRFEAVNGKSSLHEPLSKIVSQIPTLAFEMIAQGIAELDELADDARTNKLIEIRTALNLLSVWNDLPKWKALDASLQRITRDLVATRLKDATAAAKSGDLERAVRLAREVEGMAGGSAAKSTRALRTQWERELKLQKSAQARSEHLKRIGGLVAAEKPLAAAREIALFEKLYGRAAAPLELAGYRASIEKGLAAGIEAVLAKAEELQKKSEWSELRKELAQLDGIPLSAAQKSRYDAIGLTLASLKLRADALMIQVRRVRWLVTPDQMVQAIKLTGQVLELDPGNVEAKQLRIRAIAQAARTAKSLLGLADSYRFSSSPYLRSRRLKILQDVVKLDPDGPHGKRARELLKRR